MQQTLWELKEMQKLAAEGHELDQLPDKQLADLVMFLMDHRCVLEVIFPLVYPRIPPSSAKFHNGKASYNKHWDFQAIHYH